MDDWWHFFGFYGEPDSSKRTDFWRLVRRLHSQSDRSWLCAGDFNEILGHSEKEGGPLKAEWQIRNFRECLTDCALHYLGYQGSIFTWCNNQQEPHTVQERLDRACANAAWSLAFPEVCVRHLASPYSDHSPLLIELRPRVRWNLSGSRRHFRFEAAWLQESGCEELIASAWPSTGLSLREKVKAVEGKLSGWSHCLGRKVRDRIKVLEHSLMSRQQTVLTKETKARALSEKAELTKLILQEEIFWKQRSKVLWLKEGDRNTCFFHAKANQRHHTNAIRKLRKPDGSWTDSVEGVKQCILDYFQEVFTSSRPLSDDIQSGTEHLPTVVDPVMAEDLLRPYTDFEVTKALFSMSPLKSPGPDGMPPLFFQKFWHVVKFDVPQSLSQYRPISLCNVVYKIASKSIANRLKPWLDRIISPAQSAFVPGRLIMDNVLLAFETNHFLNIHSKGRKHFMNLKLDISKAYDRVEWPFLRRVLGKLGFPSVFVDLIMLCVSSVSYSFLLSGRQFGLRINMRFSLGFPRESDPYPSSGIGYPLSKLDGGLGFRNLEASNLALLAKQLWRLLSRPDSLISRVLRAKYFPHSHLFDARLGARPSFTWRSIMAAMALFWAPIWCHFSRVSDLIMEDLRIWNEEVITDLFWPDERDLILQIPLGIFAAPNLLVWHYSNNGIFLVRSAYHLALSLDALPGSSGCRWDRKLWRTLWQTNIPNKAKVFLWRTIRDILPTATNLTKRMPQEVGSCPFCDTVETPMPSFLRCTFARQVWALSGLRWNLKLAHKEFLLPMQVVDFARQYLLAFFSQNPKVLAAQVLHSSSWQAPPSDWIAAPRSSELAEAFAAREAIRVAHLRQWRCVILEGDCNSLIRKLSSTTSDFSISSSVVEDVRLLSTMFAYVSFSFVLRSGNSAVDLLAKRALNQEGDSVYLPPGLAAVILAESSN
ncbi:UNVERIFIED_CONTAM: putative mitochondrial protein [Sesamum latifolium]|uniref:Mitochondrial protein n=1 Tax=Sesamum latifolium TaxID=2727402 RepID=A0AAW2Y2C8_9LAMI